MSQEARHQQDPGGAMNHQDLPPNNEQKLNNGVHPHLTKQVETVDEEPYVSLDTGDFHRYDLNNCETPTTSKHDQIMDNNVSTTEVVPVTTVVAKPPPISSMEEESIRDRMHTALLKHCSEILHQEESTGKFSREVFRRAFQNRELLKQLFHLFDQDRDNQLKQDHWIEFLKERVTDEIQIDFAEQVESVAYVLCGDDPINIQQFYQIFNAKGIIEKLFRIIDQDADGIVYHDEIMEFLSNITNTRARTGFDKKSIEWLEQLFRQTVGNEREIRREDFKKIVLSKNPFFTERVFQIFDKDNSGSISLQEFIDAMHQFAGQTPDDKIKFLFKVYDLDGDGLIQPKELQHVMRACMEENGMQFSEDQIDDLTFAMFEDADPTNRGAITYEALKNQLEKHGGLLENLSISIDRWLVPPKPKPPPASFLGKILALRPYQLSTPYMKNNYIYLIFLALFLIVNIALFVSRAIQYKNSNGYVIVARACGQCLNFNCMFVLVLMLRQSITFLRTRGFSSYLPLDQHIYFHKLTGTLIAIYSVVHTISHLLNFSLIVVNDPVVNEKNYTTAEWLVTTRPGLFGLIPGFANPTGIILVIIFTIMFVCSQAFVRRGGCFEIFYWTHLLYVPFWVLVTLHGPNFWKWFLIPVFIYFVERINRFIWMRTERGKTYISSGLLLPSMVTHLVIKRPLNFDYHPGDYIFVNIPAIAKYEWHPFTISSAPEQEGYMWLHIRAVGQWTNRLFSYFEREQERLHKGEVPPLGGDIVLSSLEHNGNNSTMSPTTPMQIPNIVTISPSTISTSSTPMQKIQASIQRKFNNDRNRLKRMTGYSNDSFCSDDIPPVSASDGELHNHHRSGGSNDNANVDILNYQGRPRKMQSDKTLRMLLLSQKVPLEKSLSMPDMQTKAKKRERLLALREYTRSESEKSFDECQIRRARLQSLGLAYLSPQNKSLAQSFRYMRNKPTIIAFKTPSLENCEQRDSSSSFGSSIGNGRPSFRLISPETALEEGQFGMDSHSSSPRIMNYPVGKPLEIFLDGPYGAPSSHIFRAQHAVLIATGIGVTPFASILQSIMHRYWKARHCCPKCKFSWASDIPPTIMNLRKVDFFWINRDQRSFEWFVNLLSQLEIEQAELGGAMERFLEMHMYITSALQKTDMKAVGLQLALDLLHEKEKRDLITGLKTRTNAGRPNWDKVFKQLQDQKKGKITVFYCGPPQLARILRVKCDQFGFSFRKEVF
ncbi:NADPH oxidase 5-like [Chrysoperla carnea]|uniref:NADPH oxidase 5-like n=1 Tax=Chrysoperla carnea TaxID=189513 RepID=UPI001D08DB51|nr:NADPH oxidase 5-like [Chrysoperla carnea]